MLKGYVNKTFHFLYVMNLQWFRGPQKEEKIESTMLLSSQLL